MSQSLKSQKTMQHSQKFKSTDDKIYWFRKTKEAQEHNKMAKGRREHEGRQPHESEAGQTILSKGRPIQVFSKRSDTGTIFTTTITILYLPTLHLEVIKTR